MATNACDEIIEILDHVNPTDKRERLLLDIALNKLTELREKLEVKKLPTPVLTAV